MKELSSVRIHCFDNYSWGLSFIVSGERIITVEYDSSNYPIFVVRDSLLQSMYSYEFPEALGYSKPIVPITGDFVLFSQLRAPMRLNIKTGIVDSTIPPNLYNGQADLSRDGDNMCYVAASNSGLFFYKSSNTTSTKIIDGPSKGYLHSPTLSPDDKHVAYIYSPGYYSDDQIVVVPVP
jgi:hypothetical protein